MKLERGMRVGRNEKCPCGSGKKYKKCCLLKKRVLEQSQFEGIFKNGNEKEETEKED